MDIGKAKKYLIGMAFTSGLLMSTGMALAVPCSSTSDPPSAPAGYVGVQYSTVYCGNDPFWEGQGGYINGTPSLVKFNSDDSPDGFDGGEEGVASTVLGLGAYIDNLVLSGLIYDGDDLIGGNWSWTSDAGELLPTIMLIKAGSAWFIESVAGLLAGTFSTELLDSKNLSHISFYDSARVIVPPEVPLPAALPLLLTALGGMTWLSRRRKSGSLSKG